MSVLPIAEQPEPPSTALLDLLADELLIPPLVEPRPVPDPAIRYRVLVDGEPVTPATAHIPQTKRWRLT